MERSRQSTKPAEQTPSSDFHIQSAVFSSHTADTACARFVPLHYEPGYAYPLVLWLHGQGSDERQLLRVMPLVSMRNYVAVAPRGTCIRAMSGSAGGGYGWQQSDDSIQQAEQRIFDCIDLAQQGSNIALRRIFLGGFDCGGTMAFRVAMKHPNRFAGVMSFCGQFPGGSTPLGRLTDARKVPVFLAVGRDSCDYPPAEVCANLRLFHTAGLSVTLRQYPCGHELTAQMLSDMDRWVMEQITSSARCAAEPKRQWSREID